MRHIAHYPGQHVHPMLAKTAVNFDFSDLTTINPDTGRFRSVVPEGGNPKYRGYNILELLEDALANAVSFTPMVSYEEPTTVSVTCVESGWSASVDASKEGWGLRLLEQAEAHDDDYMGKWLDENSDFSGYRASRKTATGEMSEADLTPDGEWGFWVQVADAVGGTIHPFDKYQGPYIRYNGNKFWLQSDETGDFVYNETTDELRPSPLFFEDTEASDVAYIAEEIRDMARTSSRKTAEMSSSKHRYWRSKGYNIGAKVVANGYEPSDGDIEPLDGQFPGDSIPDVFGDDSDVEDLGGTLEEAIEAYEEGWWEAVEAARWDSDY